MASINNIVHAYGLSHRQALLFGRLRRLKIDKTITPVGYDKRSMKVLVECGLAEESKDTPGAYVLGEEGQPMGYHLMQSGHFEQIGPNAFRMREGVTRDTPAKEPVRQRDGESRQDYIKRLAKRIAGTD